MVVVEVGIYTLFEALSIVFCLHYLYGKTPHFNVITVGYILFDVTLMETIYVMHLGQMWSLLMYPIIMIYCGYTFGYKIKIIFINIILNIGIIGIIQTTIMLLLYGVLGIKKLGELEMLFVNVLTFGIIIFILKKCKLKRLSNVIQRNEKLIVTSLTFTTIIIILFIINCKQNRGFSELYYVTLGISVVLIMVVAVDIGKHKMKVREAEAELRLHKLYEASFQNLISDICARQHEFDNHINTIYSQHFLYKTYDELVEVQKKYCAEIVAENHFNKLLSKGNPIILGFLYGKFSEIEKKGIEITYKVNIGELESKVPVYKLIELLGNLINNAVDALLENGKGKIYVKILEEKQKIYIEVSNVSEKIDYTKIQEFFKKGYSGKGKNRGYGLYNVKKICVEYDIVIVCENRDIENQNWLTFSLTINKPL